MKISFSLSFLIAFFALVFLIQELHDWAHVLTANWICGCWGSKGFDNWTLCDHCEVSGNILLLVWLAGPALSYFLVWVSWALMNNKNSGGTKSIGFSLFFATNTFVNVLAAIGGGGDITKSMRMAFQKADGSNRHIVSAGALFLVVLLTAPPVLRAFKMVKGKAEKMLLIPALLILPNYVKMLTVTFGLNLLLKKEVFQEEFVSGIPLLVLIWLFLTSVLILLNYKSLQNFIRKKEKKMSLRI
jgi:hypothetical protein